MQQGHGFYNSSIVNICEKHGYQIALGSLYPMDHMFQNQAKLLVKNMLWRVRFDSLLVDTLKLLIFFCLLVLHSIGIEVWERFYNCKVFSYKTYNDLKGEVSILGPLHNMAKGRDHCEGPWNSSEGHTIEDWNWIMWKGPHMTRLSTKCYFITILLMQASGPSTQLTCKPELWGFEVLL